MVPIMGIETNEVIRQAREELKTRVANREQNDKRIAELRVLLRTLVRFMPDESQRQEVLAAVDTAKRRAPFLTEAISQLLMRTKGSVTSNEIREFLEVSGFDLDEYSQPLGAIMAVLKRL